MLRLSDYLYKNEELNMKRTIKLTESDLHRLISESVKQVMNEGHWDSKVADDWAYVRETVGDDTMLSELFNYLSGDQIEDFLYDHMGRNYDEVNFDEPEEL